VADDVYQFSARIEIDYLNEKYKFDLPGSEEYETLGGFIISIHESIPEKGEIIASENAVFTVDKVSDNKIEIITLERIDLKR
jgi:putative hemolysin